MEINVHHYIHFEQDAGTVQFRKDVLGLLQIIKQNGEAIMRTLDETLAAVTAEDTKVDSIIVLVNGLKQQLADALAGTTLPPAIQAKVDAIFDTATASAGKIDAAITANTPAAPTGA